MKKALFVFAAAATMFAGCQMAEDFAPKSEAAKEAKVFTGIIDNGTKSSLSQDGENLKVAWTAGSKVTINGLKADQTTSGSATYTAGDGGSTYTYFSMLRGDTLATGPYVAYSPAGVDKAFPGVQSQTGTELGWIPMMAQSETQTLSFKNLGGLLKLNITTTATGASVKTIVLTADQPLAGAYTLVDGAAVITPDSGTKAITLECGEGVAIGSTAVPFYIAVPAGTYTGMSIKVNTTDGKSQTLKMKSASSLTVARSKYYEADFAFNNFEATTIGGQAILPTGPEFNGAIKQQSLNDPLATSSSIDHVVTKIIFDTNSANTNGVQIQSMDSEKPVYLSVDPASGVAVVSSPASELVLPADASYMFATLGNMEEIVNLKCLNTENCEDMSYMFCLTGCDFASLKSVDLSNFNTEKVTTMRSMFNGCSALTEIDLSKFNTSNVETFLYMFQYCSSLKKIDCSSFNTENCTDFSYMFPYCYELEEVNVSSFNTENATTLKYMFAYCYKLQKADLKNFDCSNAANIGNFFWHCHELSSVDVSNFNPESATEMRSFFNRCDILPTIDLTNWNPESVTASAACGYFFYGAIGLKDLYCGESFMFSVAPSTPFSMKFSSWNMAAGTTNGGFTIHCSQDVCDYWATTGLRWLHWGDGANCAPLNIVFKDWKTGIELQPALWKAN